MVNRVSVLRSLSLLRRALHYAASLVVACITATVLFVYASFRLARKEHALLQAKREFDLLCRAVGILKVELRDLEEQVQQLRKVREKYEEQTQEEEALV